jgi:hypothetical protein
VFLIPNKLDYTNVRIEINNIEVESEEEATNFSMDKF